MRKLASITADILPVGPRLRSFARRPVNSYADRRTVLMLFRHAETDTELQVSDDDDATGAVWIPKTLITVDRASRGRFLVVKLPQKLADQHRLWRSIFDRKNYLPEERTDLEAAIQAVKQAQLELNYGRRGAPLHPNATA